MNEIRVRVRLVKSQNKIVPEIRQKFAMFLLYLCNNSDRTCFFFCFFFVVFSVVFFSCINIKNMFDPSIRQCFLANVVVKFDEPDMFKMIRERCCDNKHASGP